MIRLAFPLIALAAGACTYGERPQAEAPPALAGKCVADGLAGLNGKKQSEAVAKEALRLSGAKTIRWIAPGMAVTMDYREDRLNLNTDEQGKIIRAHCG
ncbi:I78 family peptidase inhibitor [Sphingomonas sp. DG1-23]|uniref:I78 family peptidase inhibitor n=1 Tax=Sphingomonas sp. DG1-23 TaxID=3068316 RepID=UPI00273D6A9D|nr:I78 family peptidase inhibitor [Sphingomonas sp. DG1-23]MDP5278478.1 I78 family peptidase inhibitor [Sphingomonas sp. DG1-23]